MSQTLDVAMIRSFSLPVRDTNNPTIIASGETERYLIMTIQSTLLLLKHQRQPPAPSCRAAPPHSTSVMGGDSGGSIELKSQG